MPQQSGHNRNMMPLLTISGLATIDRSITVNGSRHTKHHLYKETDPQKNENHPKIISIDRRFHFLLSF